MRGKSIVIKLGLARRVDSGPGRPSGWTSSGLLKDRQVQQPGKTRTTRRVDPWPERPGRTRTRPGSSLNVVSVIRLLFFFLHLLYNELMFANAPVIHGSWPNRDKLAEKFVAMRKASFGKETHKWMVYAVWFSDL